MNQILKLTTMKIATTTGKFLLAGLLALMYLSSQAQAPTYELYVTNQSQVSSKVYKFDVYLRRTGDNALELAAIQFGLGFDTSIANGGTLTFSMDSGSSQLGASQVPISFSVGTTSQIRNVGGVIYRFMNQAGRTGPGAGSGTVISNSKTSCAAPGTRIGTYRLTNTVDFKAASTAKHVFSTSVGSGITNTVVTGYVSGVNTTLNGTSMNYNVANTCDQNLSLNGCGVVATVSASSSVSCFGNTDGSATISLSGLGVVSSGTYSIDAGTTQSYVSNPFTVGGLSKGSHSIAISSGNCSANTGSFNIGGPSAALASEYTTSACFTYTLPWGGEVTTSGDYNHVYTSSGGCDSTVTAHVTISTSSSGSESVSVCSANLPYSWNGMSISTAGTYTDTLVNAGGCDSIATLILTIGEASSSLTNMVACSAVGNSTLPVYWNGIPYSSTGVYTYDASPNAAGCDSIAYLNLVVTATKPLATATAAITQTLVSNVCGARIYRYTAASVLNATGYAWTLPESVGGVAGVVVDSGDATFSRIIRLRYTSNAAALATDSIKVRPYSGCGMGAIKGAKLTNLVLNPPALPKVTQTIITANACSARRYAYVAPALPGATTTAMAATGYDWKLVGSVLGATGNYVIDSFSANSQIMYVTFLSNAAAAADDSVMVRYNSGCGYSAWGRFKLAQKVLLPPAAPKITATNLVTNVCGGRQVRYSVLALPAATASNGAATGYEWSFVGSELNATEDVSYRIDSGDVNTQAIIVTYLSNAAAAANDSIRCRYNSNCGYGPYARVKNALKVLNPPAAPVITPTNLVTNVCGARRVRYSVPVTPGATLTAGAATGYEWSFLGAGLGANAVIDSGDENSRVIVVLYTSNEAALATDSVRCRYNSNCGFGAYGKLKIALAKLNPPLAPASIGIVLKADTCGARYYRYTAPVLPLATATAGAATGYEWVMPVGPVGSTGTLDSGSLTSRIIVIKYTSNLAGTAADTLRLRYNSDCGYGAYKGFAIGNKVKTGCPAPAPVTKAAPVQLMQPMEMDVKVFPNPSTSNFNMQIRTSEKDPVIIRVMDVQGRFVKSMRSESTDMINFGSDLKAGIYMVEIRQGRQVKTLRVVKL